MIARNSYIDGVVGPQSYHLIPKMIKEIEKKKIGLIIQNLML